MCEYTTYRGWPCCSCLAEWLPVFEELAQDRGELSGKIKILQLRGSNPNSADTHSQGGAFDLGYYTDPQASDFVWIARQMGADATWYRDWDGNHHVHGVLTNCPRNGPAAYQIDAVRDGYNGLGENGRGGPDDGPKPLSGRTWQQGIEWAEEQMGISDDDIKRIWDYPLKGHNTDDESPARSHLVMANWRASDLQNTVTKIPANVWGHPVSRGDNGPYAAYSWLTQAGEASDEVRDDVNAVIAGAGTRRSALEAFIDRVSPTVLTLAVLALLVLAIIDRTSG